MILSFRSIMKNSHIVKTLLFSAMIILGIIFIINHDTTLKISFFIVGGILLLAAAYMLICFIASKNGQNQPLSFLRIISIVILFIGGLAVILYTTRSPRFYQGILASLFFFHSMPRLLYAYISNKSGQKQQAVIFLFLAMAGFGLAFFFSFYHESEQVVGIVAGIAVIAEALYGLCKVWWGRLRNKTKVRDAGYASPAPKYSYPNNGDEIVITNYEIVEDNNNKGQ